MRCGLANATATAEPAGRDDNNALGRRWASGLPIDQAHDGGKNFDEPRR